MPEARFCPSCGARRTRIAPFCGKCGHRFPVSDADGAPGSETPTPARTAPAAARLEAGPAQPPESASPPVTAAATVVAPAAGPATEVAPAVTVPNSAAAGLDVLSLVAAGLIGLGSVLPWYSGGGESISSWEVPVPFLLSETSTATGPDLGILLVLAALVLAIPALVRWDVTEWVAVGAGAIAVNGASTSIVRASASDIGLSASIGVFVVLAGGAVVFVDRLRRKMTSSQSKVAS